MCPVIGRGKDGQGWHFNQSLSNVQDNSFAWTLKETKMTRDINGNVDEVYTDEITKYDISGKRFIYNNWGLGSY